MSFEVPWLNMKFHFTKLHKHSGSKETDTRRFVVWCITISCMSWKTSTSSSPELKNGCLGVTRETDRRSREMRASISCFIDEQHDIRKVVEDLAQQVEAIKKNGTHPKSTSADSSPEQATTEPERFLRSWKSKT